MSKIDLRRVNLHRPAGRRIVGLILLAAVLVGAQKQGWLSPLRVVSDYTIAPIGSWFAGLGRGTGGFFGTLGTASRLAEENARLRSENSDLKTRISQDAELKVENAELRRQLNFNENSPFELVEARVIAYQPDNFRQFLTVNRGSRDGLKEGQAVVSQGTLVGKISEVSLSSAKVFLVSDPDFKVAAISQESRASGIVSGQLGGGLLMDKIPQSDTISPGDSAITSGLGGEFPKGLIIGRIESVSSAKGDVFQSARISNGLQLARLDLVAVAVGRK